MQCSAPWSSPSCQGCRRPIVTFENAHSHKQRWVRHSARDESLVRSQVLGTGWLLTEKGCRFESYLRSQQLTSNFRVELLGDRRNFGNDRGQTTRARRRV